MVLIAELDSRKMSLALESLLSHCIRHRAGLAVCRLMGVHIEAHRILMWAQLTFMIIREITTK